ncbi:MAG: hypothetical protein KIS95_10690 [Anaerolineae bacterium]|nr:hypothetical protein [Anaerolineales bacterium]MCB8936571.1 hypothetical protein [Promineifilum sp.]MCW5847688.1 hypothetical protein [Anaerolineae bacterium]
MMQRKSRVMVIWLLVGLFALGLSACGGSEDKPVAGYPDAEDNILVEDEAAPGEVVTTEPGPTEEIIKGDEEGLEAVRGGLEWRREGGIAGFCDVVTVLAGTATVSNCATDPPQVVGEITLTNEQSQLMLTWLEEVASFEHEQSDGAVADSMSIVLTFEGQGDNEATADVMAEMEKLAMDVLATVNNQ